MTHLEDRPPPAVGAYWINEEDYPALVRMFTDGNRMPRTWKEWLKIAEELPEIVVMHHQQAGSDAGYQGYQLVLEDGHASFSLVHFWPGIWNRYFGFDGSVTSTIEVPLNSAWPVSGLSGFGTSGVPP